MDERKDEGERLREPSSFFMRNRPGRRPASLPIVRSVPARRNRSSARPPAHMLPMRQWHPRRFRWFEPERWAEPGTGCSGSVVRVEACGSHREPPGRRRRRRPGGSRAASFPLAERIGRFFLQPVPIWWTIR